MSTQLEERPLSYIVSTVSGDGGRKRMARGRVRIAKGDIDALKAEMTRQALALRRKHGIQLTLKELGV